jgi:hypothetical protein
MGFLSGLRELLLGGDTPVPGATATVGVPTPDPQAAMFDPSLNRAVRDFKPQELQAAPTTQHKQGLLSQFGNYLISPEGRLAIGTTLRAGTGNENAFNDQARVRARWDTQAKEADLKSDLDAKNEAFNEAFITDEKGRSRYDRKAHTAALIKRGYKGDIGTAMKEAKALHDDPQLFQGARGQITSYDPESGKLETLQKGGPEQTEFDPGKWYLIPKGEGAPSAAATPTADGLPPPPPPPVGEKMAQPVAPAASPHFDALIQQESHNRPGVLGPQTQYGRAEGLSQMLPATAEGVAKKLGVPWRPDLMRATTPEGAEYQRQLGRAYYDEGLQKYGGDEDKAAMYYHGGPDEKLWGPKTRAYAQAIRSRVGAPGPAPQAASASLEGSDAGDRITSPPPNLPPAPEGYQWFSPGPAAPKEHWVDLPGGGQRNTVNGETHGVKAPGPGKLSAPQTKQVNESLFALGTASSINSRIDKTTKQLDSGLLTPSLLNSAESWAAGKVGVSTPQQRAFNSFKSDLEKLRNDSLRLNKGVQTEGDAQRAWNEILTNLTDPKFVRQRLAEIQDYNRQAIDLHKAMVNQNREDAGMEPVDFSKFEAQPTPERNSGATAPVRVKSVAEAQALKPGTPFITPDGRSKVR